MTRKQVVDEIKRIKAAITKTDSRKLKKDYEKHLKRLQNRLLYDASLV